MSKAWIFRLGRHAEQGYADIARWTDDHFGPQQAGVTVIGALAFILCTMTEARLTVGRWVSRPDHSPSLAALRGPLFVMPPPWPPGAWRLPAPNP